MTFILETGQYFGTSQNGIEDKKNGTEGVINKKESRIDWFCRKLTNNLTILAVNGSTGGHIVLDENK